MKNTKSFAFPNMVSDVTRQMKLISNKEAIETSLKSLLSTSKGELLGDPLYGTNILKYVYHTNDVILADIIRTEICTAVSKYEKRITVNENDISIIRNENDINIVVGYQINSTGYDGYVDIRFEL